MPVRSSARTILYLPRASYANLLSSYALHFGRQFLLLFLCLGALVHFQTLVVLDPLINFPMTGSALPYLFGFFDRS